MPSLRVEMFEGRTPQQKRDLARELTDACVRVLGGSPETAAQPLPFATMWYSMTCSHPGITASAISFAASPSADHWSRKLTY